MSWAATVLEKPGRFVYDVAKSQDRARRLDGAFWPQTQARYATLIPAHSSILHVASGAHSSGYSVRPVLTLTIEPGRQLRMAPWHVTLQREGKMSAARVLLTLVVMSVLDSSCLGEQPDSPTPTAIPPVEVDAQDQGTRTMDDAATPAAGIFAPTADVTLPAGNTSFPS